MKFTLAQQRVAKPEFDKIIKEKGTLLPRDVVTAAAYPENPLHNLIGDWDNDVAGDKWRLEKARRLIRAVCEYEIVQNKREIVFRTYTSLTTDRKSGNGYRPTIDILTDAQMRRQLLADALEDLRIFEAKYAKLQELAQVFAAIRKIRHKARAKTRRKTVTRQRVQTK